MTAPSKRSRLVRLGVRLGGLALVVVIAAGASRNPVESIVPPAAPAANIAPNPSFRGVCPPDALDNEAACVNAAIAATNRARAREGLAAIHLPVATFVHEPVAVQLFVIANLERVARGLPPFTVLSKHLDVLATAGARANTDPAIHGAAPVLPGGASILNWSANWAGNTENALISSYLWMYEDGPGAFNIDCNHAGAPECWGHRANILSPYPQTSDACGDSPTDLAMGAAVTLAGPHHLPSFTTLYVGACGPPVDDALMTWPRAEALLRIRT
jgi:hypothetical protein